MVWAHYLWAYSALPGIYTLIMLVYAWHMPAFAFVSGYFSHRRTSPESKMITENAARHFSSHEVNSLVKLCVTYIVFNSGMVVAGCLLGQGTHLSLIEPAWSSWYLLSLISWRLTVRYAVKVPFVLPASVAVAFLIGFWSDVNNSFALARTICFYPFFLAGYLLPTEKITHLLSQRNGKRYILGSFIFSITLLFAVLCIRYATFSQWNVMMIPYHGIWSIVQRGFMFIVSTAAITGLFFLTPNRTIPLLNHWGRNSLSIYILHRPVTFIFLVLVPVNSISPLNLIILSTIATLVTMLVFSTKEVSEWLNSLLNTITKIIYSEENDCIPQPKRYRLRLMMLVIFLIVLTLPIVQKGHRKYRYSQPPISVTMSASVTSSTQAEP